MSEPTSHPEAERIEDEAAVWAARLRGGALTDADRALLQAWLERDPEHRWVLSRYRELSAELDGHFDGGAEPFVQQATRRRHRRIVAGVLAAAAALAVLFIVLGARPQEFATRLAERHIATLADGSRIELNAQTRLTVKLTRHERHVRLLQGEALFTVAKDPLRPFVVDTPAGAVRVTGTVFNVRTSPAAPGHGEGVRAEVTVLEGHVRVRPTTAGAEDDTALVPGRSSIVAFLSPSLIESPTCRYSLHNFKAFWRADNTVL